jgi:two-component system phosphate regulon sensor histidine kinase PhoR
VKNLRPSILILLGSLLYLVLSISSALLFHLFVLDLSPWVIIFIPVISALVVFILFYALLKNFIQNRLHLIYKSIQTKQQVVPFKGSTIDNLISTVEIDVRNWQKNKNKEITKLRDQEQFRREFLGNLAHELKTPVFAVQGYILTLIEGGIDDQQVNVQFLERASRATDRIVNILEDLDQIAKLEVDALKIEMRSFEIIDLIKEIVETLELKAKEKNISLRFHNDLSSIYVTADRNKISQVLTNLINNAISYGKIDGEVVISAVPIDDLVTIEVKDNGIGIETEHFPRLFERFYRVEKSRNRNEGGTGLGLAIVKHIIESHQQSINVRSSIGIGSTFSFSLKKSIVSGPVSSRGIPLK